jgi:hypothetical protein
MRHITGETRCEKCAEILTPDYEEDGLSWLILHERLKITTLDLGFGVQVVDTPWSVS